MESNLVVFLSILAVAIWAAQASPPPHLYWKLELPDTPMPKVIRDILPTGLSTDDEKIPVLGRENKVYTAVGTRVSDDEDWSLYFGENDLRPGKKMSLRFIETTNPASFLQRKVVESMPFSPRRLSDIFRKYSVKPGSAEAEQISNTLDRCVGPGSISLEDKSCAASLESMVDFATTRLGNNLQTSNSEVKEQAGKQDYTIQSGIKKLEGDKFVFCHKLHYPYAIFYCHSFKATEAYVATVPVKGSDGTTAEPLAVCHTNTTEWDPNYHPLKMLNIKPGTIPLCHFLAQDSIVYTPRA